MYVASETTALFVQIPSVSSASPTMEKEKSDKSEMFQGNAENKPAWNRFSNGGSQIKPLVVASSSWPLLSEAKKSAPCSNKSSSDALKSLCRDGSSSSVSLFSKVCYNWDFCLITDTLFGYYIWFYCTSNFLMIIRFNIWYFQNIFNLTEFDRENTVNWRILQKI